MGKIRKRSMAITLVLAGVSAGCGDSDNAGPLAMRDVYSTPSDCKADWGDDADACEPRLEEATSTTPGATQSVGGAYYVPRYYGPRYTIGQRPYAITTRSGERIVVGNRAITTRTTGGRKRSGASSSSRSSARGGFGSSARSSGSSS
jgi:hypothetical protein